MSQPSTVLSVLSLVLGADGWGVGQKKAVALPCAIGELTACLLLPVLLSLYFGDANVCASEKLSPAVAFRWDNGHGLEFHAARSFLFLFFGFAALDLEPRGLMFHLCARS